MRRTPVVRILLLSSAVFVTLMAGNLILAGQQRDIPELSKRFRKYDVLKLDAKSAASQIRRTGKLLLKTSDRVFDLQLVPHDLRSADYRSQVIGSDGVARALPRSPVNTYKGFVKDMNGAEVRLTITNDTIEGAILTRRGHYFIQPARSLLKTASKDDFVFYDSHDVVQDAETPDMLLADQVAVEQDRASRYLDRATISESNSTNNIAPVFPRKLVRLATDADAEYVAALGGATQANNHILGIMNQVDGIFSVEVGVTFQIVFQNTWTNAATDPYMSAEPFAPLQEFRTYWSANFGHIQRDLAHMWSGKDMTVPGAADIAVVCRHPGSTYAFSGRVPNDPANPITASTVGLTAHEIGHNFGGIHPFLPEVLPEIAADCATSIMAGRFGTTFCDYSRSQMIGFTSTIATCLADATTPPPGHPTCVEVPINPGVAVNGALASTDCLSPSRGTNFFADRYSFNGQAGQRLTITMNSGSPGLEAFVFLIGPDGFITAQDAFNGGANSARIPATGSFTLPLTGKYVIDATSFGGQQTGNYTINVSPAGCVLSVSPTSQHFTTSGGTGTINVTATGNCAGYQFTVWPNMIGWLTPHVLNSEGTQSLGFTVEANANPAGRRAFLVVGASLGTQTGGLSIPITQSGTVPDCVLTPIAFGETVNGALSPTDCRSPIRGPQNAFADRYVFTAAAGQEIAVLASPAGNANSFLALIGPTGRVVFTSVDSGGAFHSRIPGGNGMLKLNLPGQYVIEITSGIPGFIGSYSLTLLNNEPPILFAEENSESAIALESVSMLRDPFGLTTLFNLGPDQQTRLMLIADNLALEPLENHSAVTAVAEDNLMNTYPLTVEFVGKVPGFGRLTQIVVKLPANLPPGQEVRVSVGLRGKTSNKVRFRIK